MKLYVCIYKLCTAISHLKNGNGSAIHHRGFSDASDRRHDGGVGTVGKSNHPKSSKWQKAEDDIKKQPLMFGDFEV